MKIVRLLTILFACLLVGCSSTKVVPTSSVHSYNGTAAVGDFLTISVDSAAHTITYDNLTNGQTGTVPYSVESDGSYTIADPHGNLLSAYEVPGSVLVVEAANAGPNQDTDSLITAFESVPVSIQTFAGSNSNYTQFRTRDGGVELARSRLTRAATSRRTAGIRTRSCGRRAPTSTEDRSRRRA